MSDLNTEEGKSALLTVEKKNALKDDQAEALPSALDAGRAGATAKKAPKKAKKVSKVVPAAREKVPAKKRGRPAGSKKKKRTKKKKASKATPTLKVVSKAAPKKRGRPPKATPAPAAPAKRKKRRGRPPKAVATPSRSPVVEDVAVPVKPKEGPSGGGGGSGSGKRRAAVLKAVAEDLRRRGSAPSRPISLRMPDDLYQLVLGAMGEIGERSVSAFLIALTRDALEPQRT